MMQLFPATASFVTALAVAGCGLTGPTLTPQMEAVRSLSNAENCQFIESNYLESRPQLIHQYVKRNAHNAGGNAYKILDVGRDVAAGMQISQITYEVYNC